MKDFMFLEDVAKELGVSMSTVRWWIGTRKLTSFRPGRRRFVTQQDLLRFISGQPSSQRKMEIQPPAVSSDRSGIGRAMEDAGRAMEDAGVAMRRLGEVIERELASESEDEKEKSC